LGFYHRSQLFDEKDKAVIDFADQVTRAPSTVRDHHLEALRRHFSEEQILELVLTTSVANFTNRVNDSLQSVPDIGV
jgi:alkylhydroperoxidase family enzyme